MIARYRGGVLRKTPGSGAIDAEGLRTSLVACLDRFDITGALEEVWVVVRRLNQNVEARREPGSSRRTRQGRASSTRSSTTSPTGSAPSRSPSRRTCRRPRRGSSTRSASPPTRAGTASRYGRLEAADGIEPAPPLFPRVEAPTRRVIDTHAHLDALDDPAAVVARAREAGVTRMLTVGTTIEALPHCARARRPARRRLRDPRHPSARGREPGRPCRRAPRAARPCPRGRGRRDGARLLPRLRTARRQRDALRRASSNLPATRASRSSSTPARPTTTRARARALRRHGYPALLLVPGAARRRARARVVRLLRGERQLPERDGAPAAATQVPADRLLAETDCPYLAPQPVRGRQNEPAYVMHTVAALSAARGDDPAELEAQIDANATALFGL